MQTMDWELKNFPEIAHVFDKVGPSTSPIDSAPWSMMATNVLPKEKTNGATV